MRDKKTADCTPSLRSFFYALKQSDRFLIKKHFLYIGDETRKLGDRQFHTKRRKHIEMSNSTYIVAWSDEDGMEYEKFQDPAKARQKLCDLFEEQAGEDFSDDKLSYYAEEWEPELKDPYSEDDEYGFRKRAIYWRKREMKLEEEDAVLTEDTAYLRRNRFGERFDARIIPA